MRSGGILVFPCEENAGGILKLIILAISDFYNDPQRPLDAHDSARGFVEEGEGDRLGCPTLKNKEKQTNIKGPTSLSRTCVGCENENATG